QCREAREYQRTKIDASYKYVFEVLSLNLGLDLTTVEEMILDTTCWEAFDSFFAKRGSKVLKVFCQGEAPETESGQANPEIVKGRKIIQLHVDELPANFVGLCVFFFHCGIDRPMRADTKHKDMLFGVLDATEGLLHGVRDMIGKIFLRSVLATNNWGALSQTKQVTKVKQNFVEGIKKYLSCLEGSIRYNEGKVELKKMDNINFSKLQTSEEVTAAANNPDMVQQLEDQLMLWYKQIQQVVIESKQIKKEPHDSGPLTELEHWKCMYAKFDFIIMDIKGPDCKAVINVLNAGHSKRLRMWQELYARITEAANESKNNVKYLRILEEVCQPLYSYDVISITHGVPNLINAIRMIHRVSRHYSTSEKMTSLFIKVTNQMVTACKAYITDGGISHVWDQETSTVTGKIKDCIFLLKEYKKCFYETKQEILETLGEKPFEVSETYIFGKAEAFCRRLEKITEMITVVQTYSTLSESVIEGIETITVQFRNICHSIQKKQYDILDLRKTEFDADFVNFMTKIEGLETQLQTFMRTCFGRILSSQHALQLLQRFQNLKMPCLQEETAHIVGCILQHYVGELETIKKLYRIQKDDPPLAQNMPPVAGRILWARQLFRRINEPISFFHKHSNILASPEGKAVIRLYNKIAYVLVEFEVIYYKAWMKEISQLQYPLQATVFVRHPKTGKFLVNFDPKIPEIVRETKSMIKLGLEVPEQAKKIAKIENEMKSNKLHLEDILQCYEDLCQETPKVFASLMAPKIKKMKAVLSQGLTMFTWSSVTLENFFQEADQVLHAFNYFLKKVNDLSEVRIEVILEDISNTLLIVLPEDGPTDVENMLTCNEACTKEYAELLNNKSMYIEDAVQEIISIFEDDYDIKSSKKTLEKHTLPGKHVVFGNNEEEREKTTSADNDQDGVKEDEFRKKCKEIVAHFNHQLLDSLQRATRLSLDSLKKRIFFSKKLSVHASKSEEVTSFLKAELCLSVHDVVIVPSLDDIQQAINRMSQLILEVSRGVAQWGQRHLQNSSLKAESYTRQVSSTGFVSPGKTDQKWEKEAVRKLRNFYSGVADHEDISELVALLSSFEKSISQVANEVLEDFQKYKVLCTEDRDAKIEQFLASCPSLSEIQEEIHHKAMLEKEVEDLKPIILLGPIELNTEPLKITLAKEANAWKMLLCHYINKEYKKKLTGMMSFITEYLKKLSEPLCDLDDVRLAMEALSNIRDNEVEMDMTLEPIE
ncbi:DYH8 protein, partial [Bucco capensis]|nr:DYH8 protein [Bucco capensis]